jgi:hypothetical protein
LKQFFSYILLLTLVLRPLYNIGYVAYFELNIDYIIETYCENKAAPELKCNGKCHLANQLAFRTDTETSSDALFNSFYEAFLPVYFQDYKMQDLSLAKTALNLNNWNYSSAHASFCAKVLSPPPEWAC